MHPFRGFLFSFTAGLALLFSAQGVLKSAFPEATPEVAPADLGKMTRPLTVA